MPVPDHPYHLRSRARHLRALAVQLEQCEAMSLERAAGPDTWHGPRPDACVRTLVALQAQLHQAIDDVRMLAHRLDAGAADLERAAAGTSGWGGVGRGWGGWGGG
jgi:hypothetical protein